MTEDSGRTLRSAWQGAVAAIVVVTAVWAAPLRGAELLDRVLAVVSGTVITLSDARAVIALGLVDPKDATDPVEPALRWLVDRQLVLDEASRSGSVAPDAAQLTQSLDRIRRRFPSEDDYRATLARLGLNDSRVRGLAHDTLVAQRYVERRFDTILPATDDELREFFAKNPERFVRDTRRLAFDEALDEVRAVVQEERHRQAVAAWMERLRRRADITEIYQSSR